jgi:hypothetical protein
MNLTPPTLRPSGRASRPVLPFSGRDGGIRGGYEVNIITDWPGFKDGLIYSSDLDLPLLVEVYFNLPLNVPGAPIGQPSMDLIGCKES